MFLGLSFSCRRGILEGAMSHTAHVREEALHLENVRQLFQVLRVIQYQEFIVFYLSHPLTVHIVIRSLLMYYFQNPIYGGQLRKSTEQAKTMHMRRSWHSPFEVKQCISCFRFSYLESFCGYILWDFSFSQCNAYL